MPASDAVRTADLAATDLESITAAQLRQVFGASTVCRFSYAAEGSVVAAATAPGAADSRGLIKVHGRLVPMKVRYRSTAARGFELSGDQVDVIAGPSAEGDASEMREAEARFRAAGGLEVGYAGFYTCAP